MKLYSTPVTNRENSFAVKPGMPSRSVCVVTLRIPYEVLTAIREAAHGSGLSMNEYLTRTICCNALDALKGMYSQALLEPRNPTAYDDKAAQALHTFTNGASHVPANPQ